MNYSSYEEFYEIMNQMSHSLHKQHLVPSLIPMIGKGEELEKGIQVLDVGCGRGFHIFELGKTLFPIYRIFSKISPGLIFSIPLKRWTYFRRNTVFDQNLASHYPNSQFTGVDLTQAAVEGAKEEKAKNDVKNVEFICQDAKHLKPEWEGKFDLVFIFDACHDQTRPDLVSSLE